MSVQSAAGSRLTGSCESVLHRLTTTTGGIAVQAVHALLEWQQRVRERRQLMSLDDRMLRDIGLSRGDIHKF